jgi:hypothetical protein
MGKLLILFGYEMDEYDKLKKEYKKKINDFSNLPELSIKRLDITKKIRRIGEGILYCLFYKR